MSADLIALLKASIADADDDMADAITDAQSTGERLDLDDWHVEVPVEWLRKAASALEAAETRIASVRDESVEECARVVEARLNSHSKAQANAYASGNDQRGELLHARYVEAWQAAEAIRALRAPPAPKQEGM